MNDKNQNNFDDEFEALRNNYRKSVKSIKPSSDRLNQRVKIVVELHEHLYYDEKEKTNTKSSFLRLFVSFWYKPVYKVAFAAIVLVIIFSGTYYFVFNNSNIKNQVFNKSVDLNVQLGDSKVHPDDNNKIYSETINSIPLSNQDLSLNNTKMQDTIKLFNLAEKIKLLSNGNLSFAKDNHDRFVSDWVRFSEASLLNNNQSRIVLEIKSDSISVILEKFHLVIDSDEINTLSKKQLNLLFKKAIRK